MKNPFWFFMETQRTWRKEASKSPKLEWQLKFWDSCATKSLPNCEFILLITNLSALCMMVCWPWITGLKSRQQRKKIVHLQLKTNHIHFIFYQPVRELFRVLARIHALYNVMISRIFQAFLLTQPAKLHCVPLSAQEIWNSSKGTVNYMCFRLFLRRWRPAHRPSKPQG